MTSPNSATQGSEPSAGFTPAPTDTYDVSAGAMLRVTHRGDDWCDGDAITPLGLVSVYHQGRLTGQDEHTQLGIVLGGRLYVASWDRTFTDRFLVTLAVRFARAVAAKAGSPS